MYLISFFLMSECPYRWFTVELAEPLIVFALFLTLFKDLKQSHFLGDTPPQLDTFFIEVLQK